MFRAIHSLLTRASNASKILWPAIKSGKSRGRHLREILGIDEQHPLRGRTLRNHLEHFDERLDKWAKKGGSRQIAKNIIGPLTMISGVDRQGILRWYDPGSTTMIFRDESFNIMEVVDAVQDIRNRLVPLSGQWPFD